MVNLALRSRLGHYEIFSLAVSVCLFLGQAALLHPYRQKARIRIAILSEDTRFSAVFDGGFRGAVWLSATAPLTPPPPPPPRGWLLWA